MNINKLPSALKFLVFVLMTASSSYAWSYKLYADATNGGNPKLAKQVYKVYIQANPDNPTWRDEVAAALNKWKAELGPRGIDLQLQDGNPPQQPIDLKRYNEEVENYNNDKHPDMSQYPEIKKYQEKQYTISVYWDTMENIAKRGSSDVSGGLAESFWTLDKNGKADTTEISDIFIPSDPRGGTDEIKKIQIHNVSIHEFGHPAGFDHYTKNQKGDVMQTDASLFDTRIGLKPEDQKGLDAIYGQKPNVNVKSKAEKKESSSLPDNVRSQLPSGVDSVWEYSYELTWQGGGTASYFQVETGSSTIYAAYGTNGFSEWLNSYPSSGYRYFEFYADSEYLGDSFYFGALNLYSSNDPGTAWLVNAGGSQYGFAPNPEPPSLSLYAAGIASLLAFKRKPRTGGRTPER